MPRIRPNQRATAPLKAWRRKTRAQRELALCRRQDGESFAHRSGSRVHLPVIAATSVAGRDDVHRPARGHGPRRPRRAIVARAPRGARSPSIRSIPAHKTAPVTAAGRAGQRGWLVLANRLEPLPMRVTCRHTSPAGWALAAGPLAPLHVGRSPPSPIGSRGDPLETAGGSRRLIRVSPSSRFRLDTCRMIDVTN